MRGVRAAVVGSVTLLVFLVLGQYTEGKLLGHRPRDVLQTQTQRGILHTDTERYSRHRHREVFYTQTQRGTLDTHTERHSRHRHREVL